MQLEQNTPLAPFTTFKIGGPARFYTRVTTHVELLEAVTFARTQRLSIFLLGGGSNLLITDAGFPGLVIHVTLTSTIEPQDDFLEVCAGTDWDTLVQYTCDHELTGMECLAGIPGLTGASPIQNIGAYGQEVSQTIDRVTALDLQTLTTVQLTKAECCFSYRTSLFNSTHRNRYAITSVRFRLKPNGESNLTYADLRQHFAGRNPNPTQVAEAVRAIRRSKGMLVVEGDPDSRSAGSFFKNPVLPIEHLSRFTTTPPNWPTGHGTTKLPAAWILDQAGFGKGFQLGNAGISSRHSLALINRTGHATCADILLLRDTIRNEVHSRFGITLEQEPVLLG